MVKVGLLWHSINSDNLGVGALTVSNITIVEAIAARMGQSVNFEIFGWRDAGQDQLVQSNVKVKPLRARDIIDPSRLFSWIRKCDLILDISAGDSFADIYGNRRFAFNIASKLAVFLARKPMIYSPQTIGPFQASWSRLAAKFVMRRADAIITRDTLSTKYAAELGIANAVETTDVAFRLPYELPKASGGKKIKIGINISGLLFNGGYTKKNMFGLKADYAVLTRQLISHFCKNDRCEVHLVGHVISDCFEVEDDYRVALALAAEFPETVMAPKFATPSQAKSYIAGMDFFCGSRMHACIAAFSAGVAVVPIAYSRKFSGLFGSLGYYTVGDCKTQTADEIMKIVEAGFLDRQRLKQQAKQGSALALKKLDVYEKILENHMKSVLAAR
jgi:colanic acid/amylovoran biosynthesis protein